MTRLKLLLMLFFSSFCFITNGQNRVLENFDTYSKLLSPEKLYIQTDRDIYNAGDTIWFSGYLINSSLKNEFPESNYIYVELLTQMVEKDAFLNANVEKEGVRERIKIKREGNSFNGFIIVPENSNTSIAILRGYSYWMLNKDPEYMFNKNIEIRNPIKDEYITSLIESKNNDDISYISAGIDNPLKIKSIGKYDIDVQFLPESGHLVEGVQNNIAYKAVDSKGKGVKINGKIYADGAEQLEFESNEYGLGSFTLPILGSVKRLYAIIKNDDSFEKEILLPEAEKVGAIINILPDTSFVIIKSNISTSILDLELQLIISDASEIYYNRKIDKNSNSIKLPTRNLRDGIHNAFLVDNDNNILCQRTFFVYPKDINYFEKDTLTNKYGRRDKVEYIIKLNDDRINGDISVSVTDDSYNKYNDLNNNIISYLLLGSEIKSYVENPQQYFDTSIPLIERIKSLDLVMLTHGWSYYDYSSIFKGKSSMPEFGKEYKQSIAGKVYGLLSNNKGSIVTFYSPSINLSAVGQLDTSSSFVLTDIDFPDETKFMVGAVGKNGKSKRFTPILYDDIFAKYYNYSKYTPIVDYDNEYKNKSFIEYYNNGFDMSLSLNPIYIQGARTYKSDVIASFHNHTFKPGEYKSEADLEPFLSFDLINYLDMAYGSLRGDGDNVYARVKRVSSRMDISSGWYPVAFFVNGIQLDSGAINGLMVYDIEALAVVEGSAAEKFLSDYNDIEIQRTVVLLRTKLIKRGNSTNIVMSTPIGWQKPKKRYETKYETPASLREREPMRSTIYWNPSVKIKDGNARVSFYTSDNTYPYTVIIEGLTEYNEPIYLKDKIERVD